MTKTFMFGDETHAVGDVDCPACPEHYPESCPCGGLMHAAGDTAAEESETVLATQCDRCGRSVDDVESGVA